MNLPPSESPNGRAPGLPPAARRKQALSAKWIVLGVAVGLMGSCTAGLFLLGQRSDAAAAVLTPERLQAAEQRWQARGPASYRLKVELRGAQTGDLVVEVRQGEVVSLTRNGATPSQKRTWAYWSVPGQFDVLHTDLENAEQSRQIFQTDSGTGVLRAEFNTEYGYPVRYERLALGGMGDVRWRVTEFEPLK